MTGIFTAHTYLPELELSDEKLAFILLHEYQHYKSHDVLIKIFYLFLLVFFWWNPAVHQFQRELARLLELRCDASITKNLDDDSKLKYLETIGSVVKQTKHVEKTEYNLPATALVDISADRFLKQRFQIILSDTAKANKSHILFFCADPRLD